MISGLVLKHYKKDPYNIILVRVARATVITGSGATVTLTSLHHTCWELDFLQVSQEAKVMQRAGKIQEVLKNQIVSLSLKWEFLKNTSHQIIVSLSTLHHFPGSKLGWYLHLSINMSVYFNQLRKPYLVTFLFAFFLNYYKIIWLVLHPYSV